MKSNPSMSGGRVHASGPRPERPWQLRVGFWLLLTIAAYYLLTEHRAHLAWGLPYLPLLLLAACPLIHLFAHGGHGGHSRDRSPSATTTPSDQSAPTATERHADGSHRHGGELP
jgi:hypothetical protein